MTLPLLVSVPHAGLRVPDEVDQLCVLSEQEIVEDGDGGAAEIYDLQSVVRRLVTTDVARAIVDVNRPEGDRGADGVVKTHTIWSVPVYSEPLSAELVERLLELYHRPYHRQLTAGASEGVILGVDCHTMAAKGPPIGPGAGIERPHVCLSNADGTCPDAWIRSMAACFERAFGEPPAINDPFRGGWVVRSHARELPWIQVELSRAMFFSNDEKRRRVLAALEAWCSAHA
jgi:formiminoglutamase